jgi:hypothetical protein
MSAGEVATDPPQREDHEGLDEHDTNDDGTKGRIVCLHVVAAGV